MLQIKDVTQHTRSLYILFFEYAKNSVQIPINFKFYEDTFT